MQNTNFQPEILLMDKILHRLIGSLSFYLQGLKHTRRCRISSINSKTSSSNEFHKLYTHTLFCEIFVQQNMSTMEKEHAPFGKTPRFWFLPQKKISASGTGRWAPALASTLVSLEGSLWPVVGRPSLGTTEFFGWAGKAQHKQTISIWMFP